MPLSVTPYAVPGGTATAVPCGILPAGPFYAAISGGTAAGNGIFVGEGPSVSASTGLWVPGGAAPVPLNGFEGAGAQQLYAVAQSGTVTAVLMVSTPR